MQTLVSIIMPVYNKEKYLKKAINSILNQTFCNFELIIINDGSNDSSLEICQSFTDSRITLISTENEGVSSARNKGLKISKGRYVTFIDADDFVDKDYLKNLYNEKFPMIIGGLKKVSKNDDFIENIFPKNIGEHAVRWLSQSFYQEQLDTGIYGYISSKLIRRDILEKNNIKFDININLAEDYDFFLKVYSCIDKIYLSDSCLYYYVQETDNSAILMNDSKIDFFEQIKIQIKTKNFLIKNNAFSLENEKLYSKRDCGYVYTILINNHLNNYKNFKIIFHKLKECVPYIMGKTNDLKGIIVFFYNRNYRFLCYMLLKIRKKIRR